jgi:hypothetical protein
LKVTDQTLKNIENQADFSKRHIEGIAFNTDRKVQDTDSWYIGMIRGRQLALEWALREIRGENHDDAIEGILSDGIEEALMGVKQF